MWPEKNDGNWWPSRLNCCSKFVVRRFCQQQRQIKLKSQNNTDRRYITIKHQEQYFGNFTSALGLGCSESQLIIPKQPNLYIFGQMRAYISQIIQEQCSNIFRQMINQSKLIWFTKSRKVYSEIEQKYPGSAVISQVSEQHSSIWEPNRQWFHTAFKIFAKCLGYPQSE